MFRSPGAPASLPACCRGKLAGRDAGAPGLSLAIGETEEPRRDAVLLRQLIIEQSHPCKTHHMIDSVVSSPFGMVPYRNGDIDCLQHVQCFAHLVAICNSTLPLYKITNRDEEIAMLSRIDICAAIARGSQAGHQGRFAGATCPGKPPKIAWLRAII